ncbi:ABC transporter substrate-binding protein [Bacillus salitolerans]|uniref:ABC transporter substrate-binding protein n=1 Tax=Bacillus salitolerans TaxID=1437434 RepID=A0ABW4LS05_9BACI
MIMHTTNYFMLRNHFPQIQEGESFHVSIQELANIFYCSDRYVKKIVKNLIQLGWIRWTSGRGRGNLSTITFIETNGAVGFITAKELSINNDISGALTFVLENCPSIKDEFLSWLTQHLGYQHEQLDENNIDIFRFPHDRPILTLDPMHARTRAEMHIIKHVFETLVMYNESTGAIEPHLAHSWDIDESGTLWKFYIRKGVLFHNGDELTAEDVKNNFERIMSEGSAFKSLFRDVLEVKVLKRYTLQVLLSSPNYLFLDLLSRHLFSIVHKKSSSHFPTTNIIGTGPFKIEHATSEIVTLTAYHDYFFGRPFLDQVELHKLSNDQVRLFEQYQFSVTYNTPSKSSQAELSRTEYGGMHLTFNLNKGGILQNHAFRKAIHHIIDRNELCNMGGKRYTPSSSFFPTYHLEDYENSYSITKAKNLLRQASYNNETISIYTYDKPYNNQDLLVIKDKCELAGINISTHVVSLETLFSKEIIETADLILYPETFDEHAQYNIIQLLRDEQSVIYQFLSPDLKTWVEEHLNTIQHERDSRKKMTMIESILEFFRDEYIILYLYHYKQSVNIISRLSGLSLTSLGWVDFNKVYVR